MDRRGRGPSSPASEEHTSRGRAGLGACRTNAPTSILGGTKRIGRSEIVDPEPDARSRSSSQCRQTHYSDTLLAESERLTREGFRCLLAGETDLKIVGEAADGL